MTELMNRKCFLLGLLLVWLALAGAAEERYQVLVVSPGYQSDFGIKKDLEAIASQFDFIIEAQNLGQVLESLRKLGSQHQIERLVFLGHGYLGDQDKGGLIDLGEDVSAATYFTVRRKLHYDGDARLIDAFARDAEIVYFNCHAGLDPDFLKETANLFLAFSGGTVYGSDDYVTSEVSAGNRIRYILSYLPFVTDESVSFEGPSKIDYRRFPKASLEPFLWRTVKPDKISIEGEKQVKVHSRIELVGQVPLEWTDSAYSKFIKYRWTEKGKTIGKERRQTLEFDRVGEREFQLEVFLDNDIGARKLGSATHKVKVVERKQVPVETPSQKEPPKNDATEFRVTGPAEVTYSDIVALEAEVPQELASQAASIVWFGGTHDRHQPLVLVEGLPATEGPLACPGGEQQKQAQGTRILVQPIRASVSGSKTAYYFAELKSAKGGFLARTKVHAVTINNPKFRVTLYGEWRRHPGSKFVLHRDRTLEYEEKDDKGSLTGSAGGAYLALMFPGTGHGPRFSEVKQTVTTAGGFVGNGRYFLKGQVCYSVDLRFEGYGWPRGEQQPEWRRWKPLAEQHQAQARKDVEMMLKSVRIGSEEALPQGPITRLPTRPGQSVATTAPTETKTPTPDSKDTTDEEKVRAEAEAKAKAEKAKAEAEAEAKAKAQAEAKAKAEAKTKAEAEAKAKAASERQSLEQAEQQIRSGDYQAAEQTLAALPGSPKARERLSQVREFAKRAQQIDQLAARVEVLVSQRKLPSALELIRQISDLRNRVPTLPGGKRASTARAEDLFNQSKQEYDKDWNEYSYGSGEFFQNRDWATLKQMAEKMLTWECFPHADQQVRLNLRQAEQGLAAQESAWKVYQEVEAQFTAGRLVTSAAAQQALKSLERARSEFGSQDSRWQEITGLIGRLHGTDRERQQLEAARAHLGAGRYPQALEAAQGALSANPANSEGHYLAGRALHGQGRYQEAVASYDKRLNAVPGDAETWLRRAQAMAALGNREAAEASLEEVLTLDPNNAEARRVLDELVRSKTPLSVRIDPPELQLQPGAQARTVGHANGGTPPYRYEWYVGNERTGEVNQVKLWTLNQAGTYPLRVVVTDAAGQVAEATCSTRVGNPTSSTASDSSLPTRGYQVKDGRATAGSLYKPGSRGNVFHGGLWSSSRGGSDWLQYDFGATHLVHEVRIARLATDVTTSGAHMLVKLRRQDGAWLKVLDLRESNINHSQLSGGAQGRSVGSQVKTFEPIWATALRVEITGHGWFLADDIQIWASQKQGAATTAVDVKTASAADLVGNYYLLDPGRSEAKYHGFLELYANGTGRCHEVINGKPVKPKYPQTRDSRGYLPLYWNFQNGVLTLDWTMKGRYQLGLFKGQTSGNTNDFTLQGRWANQKPGSLRLKRR